MAGTSFGSLQAATQEELKVGDAVLQVETVEDEMQQLRKN